MCATLKDDQIRSVITVEINHGSIICFKTEEDYHLKSEIKGVYLVCATTLVHNGAK